MLYYGAEFNGEVLENKNSQIKLKNLYLKRNVGIKQ